MHFVATIAVWHLLTHTRSLLTQKRGKLVCVGDDEHFYFTPQLDLINLVSCSDRDEFWDTFAAGPDAKEHAIVCWQLILKGAVFQCHFDLERFPLDSQDLEILLQSAHESGDVALCRNMNPRCAPWLALLVCDS
jgi:hypothetical protein